MDAFINELIKMSMRGIIIILIVLLVRFLLKNLRISHKYITGLWAMAFVFFVFPWKLSLSVGFWNNVYIPEEVWVIMEDMLRVDQGQENNVSVSIMNPSVFDDNITAGTLVITTEDSTETAMNIPVEPLGQKIEEINETNEIKNNSSKSSPEKLDFKSAIALLWLIGLTGLFGHMLYSYFALKRKLRLSVLYQDNIWWTENIDIPMVFGMICPQIYLPISMGFENLAYVIAHEKMHIKRKDGIFKTLFYVVCLIHWFNPFIWIAYILFENDMEKACDEEVIRNMGKERRKEYAYALLHMASENGTKKKKIFVAPICFDEGNVRSRIKNIMKFKYTLRDLGTLAVVMIMALSVLFLTEAKGVKRGEQEEQEDLQQETVKTAEAGKNASCENDAQNSDSDAVTGNETETLPAFYAADLDALQVKESFSPDDYYITSAHTVFDYYFTDEEGIRRNQFGQLEMGTCSDEEHSHSIMQPIMLEQLHKTTSHVVKFSESSGNQTCMIHTWQEKLFDVCPDCGVSLYIDTKYHEVHSVCGRAY